MNKDYMKLPEVDLISAEKEFVWMNPKLQNQKQIDLPVTMEDVEDAERRLLRFAPFIMRCFPETAGQKGLIESALTPIEKMQNVINEKYDSVLKGRLLLKQDSHLAIAGSVKARGGIYEVLKYTEELAFKEGLITEDDDYAKLAEPNCRSFFSQYTIQVGSTGNLGLSIGIASASIGYEVIVHMSSDAKQWKKELLRSHGVTVIEYDSDYGEAVKQGRKLSDKNLKSYFIDDENSKHLFLGYAVAAKRLLVQLKELGLVIDNGHPLFVYIPCGVGGAPGGITFGLKELFKDCVHCFFIEPTQAPCMLLGMTTGLHNDICVQDVGLTGLTHADGLAVGRPSGFVGRVMEPLLSGIFTVKDKWLYEYMRDILESEHIFLEPSACAAFQGPIKLNQFDETKAYIRSHGLEDYMEQSVHIAWATGGSLVPNDIRETYKKIYIKD